VTLSVRGYKWPPREPPSMPDEAGTLPGSFATLRRLLAEGRVETDLDAESLARKAAAVRPRLVEVALAGETVGYREVTDGFAVVHGARVGQVLAALGLLEHREGNPFLPAVVVEADTGLPGEWYFEMLAAADGFDERVPDARDGRRALWSTQVLEVWQHRW
jgi:hypothetical protein